MLLASLVQLLLHLLATAVLLGHMKIMLAPPSVITANLEGTKTALGHQHVTNVWLENSLVRQEPPMSTPARTARKEGSDPPRLLKLVLHVLEAELHLQWQ